MIIMDKTAWSFYICLYPNQLIFNLFLLLLLFASKLFERNKDTEREIRERLKSSIHWFLHQMPAAAGETGPGQSQEFSI